MTARAVNVSPDMPPLEIAGKDYVRILVKDLPGMDMTESPVVVSLANEFIESARGVVLVACHSAQCSMQDADIEHATYRIGIARHEVVGDVALPEALPVQRDIECFENESLRLAVREGLYIARKTEAFSNLTFRIVIAIENKGLDVGLGEPSHL